MRFIKTNYVPNDTDFTEWRCPLAYEDCNKFKYATAKNPSTWGKTLKRL